MNEENKNTTTAEEAKDGAYCELFEKLEVFNAEVKPLVEKIKEICEREGIPYLLYFIPRSDEKTHANAISMNSGKLNAAAKMAVLGNIAEGNISLKNAALAIAVSDLLEVSK